MSAPRTARLDHNPLMAAAPVSPNESARRRVVAVDPSGVVIEDGIPLPRPAARIGYPFGKLAVGQSFFVPERKSMTSVTRANKTLGPKVFTARRLEENGIEGFRVWRTA